MTKEVMNNHIHETDEGLLFDTLQMFLSMRAELVNLRTNLGVTVEQSKQVFPFATVSYNCPVDKAISKQTELENKGYLVTNSYGDDTDMGNNLEYALGENSDEVIVRHMVQVIRCRLSELIRSGKTALIKLPSGAILNYFESEVALQAFQDELLNATIK